MKEIQLLQYVDGCKRYHRIDLSTFSDFMDSAWEPNGHPNNFFGVQLGQILKG